MNVKYDRTGKLRHLVFARSTETLRFSLDYLVLFYGCWLS